jgi:hypothetical protein
MEYVREAGWRGAVVESVDHRGRDGRRREAGVHRGRDGQRREADDTVIDGRGEGGGSKARERNWGERSGWGWMRRGVVLK